MLIPSTVKRELSAQNVAKGMSCALVALTILLRTPFEATPFGAIRFHKGVGRSESLGHCSRDPTRLRVKSRKFWGGRSESEPTLMKIEMWPVDKPVPYAKDVRKISDQAVEKVRRASRRLASGNRSLWIRTT
jgi:hypothetical protein